MCPECKQAMVAFEFEGIEIDHCVICGGTWLDAGELEQIVELTGQNPGNLSRALEEARGGEKSKRRCPRCRRRLRTISVGKDNPVELDRCPAGDGFWFDQGEMKDLIEQFHDGEEEAVARFFSDLFRSELQSSSQSDSKEE